MNETYEIIIISSDDEETVPPPVRPVKRAKLTSITNGVAGTNATTSWIILSDDDNDLLINTETPTETLEISKTEENPHNRCNVETVDITIEDSEPAEALKDEPEIQIEQTEEMLEASTPNEIPDQPICAEDNTVGENGATSSNSANIQTKLFACIGECLKTVKNPRHLKQLREQLPFIKRYCKKLVKYGVDLVGLEEIIEDNKGQMDDTQKVVGFFKEIIVWLLEVNLYRLKCKIKKLEEAVVDFDDEENSYYIQTCKYKELAMQIYKKLCQVKKERPIMGPLGFWLDFSASKHPEINHAINSNYRDIITIPTYFDFDKCIRKFEQVKQLSISEENLQHEIRHCFEALGNLLQKRRKFDLWDYHRDILAAGTSTDPATEDPARDCKLHAHRLKAKRKFDEIVARYVALQEIGDDPEVSSDSDDSVLVDSDCESEETV